MAKYSRQRESILNNLRSRRDHPTADMVYDSVREELPKISLGTVYRNLSLLAEQGDILKISTNGPDHFDGFTQPHSHFICRCCGRVLDLEYVPKEQILENASQEFDGMMEPYELQFYGKCADCISDK